MKIVLFLFINRFMKVALFLFLKVENTVLFLFTNGGGFFLIYAELSLFMSEGRGAIRSPIATPTNPAITTSARITATIFLFN
jgi:hypothetical protein